MPDAVPIDLSPWLTVTKTPVTRWLRVDEACRTVGFLAVRTPHRSGPRRRDARDDGVLDLPWTRSSPSVPTISSAIEATPPESEALSYSLGIDTPPDLFEAFNAGPATPPAEASDDVCPVLRLSGPTNPPDSSRSGNAGGACADLGDVLADVFAPPTGGSISANSRA